MKRGFTLIEILLVVVILGIMAAIVVPSLGIHQNRDKIVRAKGELRALQVAIESYYLYNSSAYPAALNDLTTTVPTIIKTVPKDPFSSGGAEYVYKYSDNKKYYVVYSVGPNRDGKVNKPADTGTLSEENGASCIFVSNVQEDAQP